MFHSMKLFMYTPNFTSSRSSSTEWSFGSTNVFAIHDRLDVVVNRPSRAVAPGVHGRRGLAVLQKLRDAALLVEVAAARLHPFVVRTVVRDRVLDGRIVDDVHDVGTDPHADAVRRNERLARLARLPAEDAVRFGRVAARLVGGD